MSQTTSPTTNLPVNTNSNADRSRIGKAVDAVKGSNAAKIGAGVAAGVVATVAAFGLRRK